MAATTDLFDSIFSIISSTVSPLPGQIEPVDGFLWLVILGGFVCFAMAWGIGANDVANAFATSVGAKAITIKQAVVIAAIFEFLGAFALGANVTNTIRKKITDYNLFEGEGDVLMLGMFCSLCSASLWLYLATKYQLPVSTTQSIIGAIVGFVLVSKGTEGVVWESIIYIIIFWIASPVLAAMGSVILFVPMRKLLFRRHDSYHKTLLTWPLWIFIVIFVMSLFLMLKGLKRLDLEFTIGNASLIAALCGAVAAILSYFIFIKSGLVHKFVERHIKKQQITSIKEHATTIPMEDMEDDKDIKNGTSTLQLIADKATYGMRVDIHDDIGDLERAIHEESEVFDARTEKAFAWPQVCTATLDIFAHGSNDVANAVAPFAAMVAIYDTQSITKSSIVPWWILFIGAIGMTIGLATYGYKIMQCLGVKMGAMSSTRGYCIELSSAIVVILASYYGFPASTTHAQVGATVGVGLCELRVKNSSLSWSTVVNWRLLGHVFMGWILTLFVSGLTSAVLFAFIAYSPYSGDVCRADYY